MKRVTLYTDGACSGNPGPGGWGSILIYKEIEKELKGGIGNTTNNRMEIFAVLQGLKALKEPCEVEVYTDSAYVVNTINSGWLTNWKQNGWKTSDKQQVKNIDLWKALDIELCRHKTSFYKVKGHADNYYNNRCDAIATGEIKRIISVYGETAQQTIEENK